MHGEPGAWIQPGNAAGPVVQAVEASAVEDQDLEKVDVRSATRAGHGPPRHRLVRKSCAVLQGTPVS